MAGRRGMVGLLNVRMPRCLAGCISEQMNSWIVRWLDGWVAGLLDSWILDVLMIGWSDYADS